MANVQVIQRHAHLAGAVWLDAVNGREGRVAKAVLTAISNTRRGTGDTREEESTAIQWTLWGKLAESAAVYLGKGSHVNIIGRVLNNNFEKDGETVYGMQFVAEEIDFLDNRAEAEARRGRHDFVAEMDAHDAAKATKAATAPAARGQRPGQQTAAHRA